MAQASPRAWGAPLQRLDQIWSAIEQRLAVWVIVAEIVTLVVWVSLKGLASSYSAGSSIGLIYRSIFTSIVLAIVAHLITRPRTAKGGASAKDPAKASRTNAIAVTSASIAGLFLGRVWTDVGVEYHSNVVEWLQNASTFALVGGPRGLVTRLTLMLALLGASLAASRGKHINIDIATRYLPEKLITPVAVIGWVAAAVVCIAAAWGFLDSIAVTKFRAEAFRSCPTEGPGSSPTGVCETAVSERLGVVATGVGRDFFLFRRQLSLDMRTIPHVLAGSPYDKVFTAPKWNEWVRNGDWTDYYQADEVKSIEMPSDDPTLTKMPMVAEPGTGEGRDRLIRDLNFILPFGLLVIGLKFLLRMLRVFSGHVHVDPNSAHEDEDLSHAHDHDKDVEAAEADAVAAETQAEKGGAS